MRRGNNLREVAVRAAMAATLMVLCGAGATARAQTNDAAAPAPAAASVPVEAQGGIIRGSVKAGAVPLPGVAVTAANTLTGKKFATTTDVDGAFEMTVPRNGRYVVKAELAAFADATREVVVNASGRNGGSANQVAEFTLELASRAVQPTTTTGAALAALAGAAGSGAVARLGRGMQTLAAQDSTLSASLTDATSGAGNAGVALPTLGSGDGGMAAGADTVAVSGQQGQTNGLAGISEDDIRQRVQDMQRQGMSNGDIATAFIGAITGGGFGGPGGGGGFGGGGFGGRGGGGFGGGNFRGVNLNQFHGAFAYTGSNGAIDAIPFPITGIPVVRPAADTNTLIGSLTGSPYIPGLTKPNPKQFAFISVVETRNTVPNIAQAIVPTAAQRLGDLTGAGAVYDPRTGQPYGAANCLPALYAVDANPAACVPQSEISAAGQALLSYYPLPNITPVGSNDNYQTVTTATSHSSQVSARFNRSFGAAPVRGQRGGGGQGGGQGRNAPPTLRQSIGESFAYSHSASSAQSFSPQLGGKNESDGYNVSSQYTVGYGRLNSTATVGWNRSRSLGANYFTDLFNPALAAGIAVGNPTIYGNPFYYGVPSVGLTGLSGLGEAVTPANTVNQTISVSDFVSWTHKRHNMRYGIDFRRIHLDSIGGTNVVGAFTFSGFATEGTAAQAAGGFGGSPIADLLIGQPQQTSITAGLNKIYLRGNSWDWYVNDDWRARSNLTFQFGLRWEYYSPYSEKYGRLVNLNLAGSGTQLAIANVCATAAAGCANVSGLSSLVQPDKAMYSPRLGLAWQPKFKFTKQTVVRAGYGINFNSGQYATFARKLAFQQPFAITQVNTLTTAASPTTCTLQNLTLANGFGCSTQTTQSNYGVDPNYRLGMVQAYNLGVQRTLPQGVVLNVDYNGGYSGNLDILRAPNRTASGVLNPSSGQFTYEDSLGYQRSNALAINLRNRMHKGIALAATYTYSHSIDDASSVGGVGSSIAQNDQNLGAEESNSSFDRRHSLSGNFVMELPFGPNRAFLNKGGAMARIFDGYSVSGNYTFQTGAYATPLFSGTPQEIAAGANSLRPDRVAGTPIAGQGSLHSWFDRNAFQAPAPGVYGNASRNSIELPGTVSVNVTLSRTFALGDTRSIEARMLATNAFNTVQYSAVDTQVNSPTFGNVIGAANMRMFQYTARYRF